MESKIKMKGSAMLSPLPAVMVSCGSLEKPNIITIGWCGIVCSNPAKTYISIRPERYSYELIKQSRKFVINLTTEQLVKACDLCGVKSGRDIDKFAHCGLTAIPALELEDTPMIAECPVSIECRVCDIIEFGDTSDGKRATHDMFLADIVSVDVDPTLISESGAIRLDKAGLIAYAHGEYFALGRRIGDFGCSVRKKKTPPRKNMRPKRETHPAKQVSKKDKTK